MTLPEGRKPLMWSDLEFAEARGHPSTFEAECKQLRAENEELKRDYTIIKADRNNLRKLIDQADETAEKNEETIQTLQEVNVAIRAENEHLRERVAELEAALSRLATAQCFGDGATLGVHLPSHPIGREVIARMEFARAALQPTGSTQEGK